MDYKELNPSFVIYICRFRLFPGTGRHKYTFKSICAEDTRIELGDDTAIVFLCTEGNEEDLSPKLKSFLTYIVNEKACDEFTNKLEHAVTEAKEHKKWRQEYMTLLEHYEWERSEGRAEGQQIKLIQLILRKLEKGKTPEMIADDLEEEVGVVRMMYDTIRNNPDADDEAVYQSLKEKLE